MSGFRGPNPPQMYWSLKVVSLAVGFFLGGGVMILMRGFNIDSLTYTGILAGVCFYLPEVGLWIIKSRPPGQHLLRAPGRARSDGRLRRGRGSAWIRPCASHRGDEKDLQGHLGRIRPEQSAVADGPRPHRGAPRSRACTGVDDLKALAAILIQADKFGSSVAQALRVQSDSMCTKRRQMAEEKAAKTAVKLIFPLVLFIFPAIFVALVWTSRDHDDANELFPSMAWRPIVLPYVGGGLIGIRRYTKKDPLRKRRRSLRSFTRVEQQPAT